MTAAPAPCPFTPGRHDKEGRRRALLDAAVHVFAEHGYDAATTRAVADRAGCSEGLIHRYFGGKRGLLYAALEERARQVLEAFRDVPLAATVAEEVAELVRFQVERLWENRDIVRICLSQAIIDPEIGRMVGEQFHEARVRMIAARLREHEKLGHLRPGVDVTDLARGVDGAGFSYGFMAQAVFQLEREEVARSALALAEMLARGVAAAPCATRDGQ